MHFLVVMDVYAAGVPQSGTDHGGGNVLRANGPVFSQGTCQSKPDRARNRDAGLLSRPRFRSVADQKTRPEDVHGLEG
jgi:hypothetical protein